MVGKNKILVTGATGNLGGAVARMLSAKGFAIRAAGTRIEKFSAEPGWETVRMVYEDPQSVDAALSGVGGLFLVAPPLDPEAPSKLNPIIDKAGNMGLHHIVFISAFGVDQNEQAPLRIIERHLMASGVNFTILRPNFFMENFTTGFVAPMIAQGGIFLAADEGKTSFISVNDIAEVAAAAFQNQSYGRQYNLTGAQALDHQQVADIISEVSGRKITYQPVSEEAMLKGARDNGMPEGAVQYLAMLYYAVRSGWMAAVTGDVKTVTGKELISFVEFARQNAKHFQATTH